VVKRELKNSSKPNKTKVIDSAFHDGYYSALLNMMNILDEIERDVAA
jgi:hypothetical protein